MFTTCNVWHVNHLSSVQLNKHISQIGIEFDLMMMRDDNPSNNRWDILMKSEKWKLEEKSSDRQSDHALDISLNPEEKSKHLHRH